jgi:hypothetical protein
MIEIYDATGVKNFFFADRSATFRPQLHPMETKR